MRIRTLRKKGRKLFSQRPGECLNEREQVSPPDECGGQEDEAD